MDKHIWIKRKALTPHECKDIIWYFNKNEKVWFDVVRNYYKWGYLITDSFFDKLKNVLIDSSKEYISRHPFLGKGFHYPIGLAKGFNIQRYVINECYAKGDEHMEHGAEEDSNKRVLAWMLYLNDIKYKGGTCWPQQNFTSKPRAGDLYIWPAGWTHSHYGIPAPKEEKYIATGWFDISEIPWEERS